MMMLVLCDLASFAPLLNFGACLVKNSECFLEAWKPILRCSKLEFATKYCEIKEKDDKVLNIFTSHITHNNLFKTEMSVTHEQSFK